MRTTSLLLPLLLLATACAPGTVAKELVKAPDLQKETGLNSCKIKQSAKKPLVVEWASTDRSELEAEAKQSVVVVAYDGCEMRLLSHCTAPGAYGYTPVAATSDTLTIEDADELWASMPIGAAKFEGKLARAGQLNVAMTIIGRYTSAQPYVRRDELTGVCDGATHILANLTVGAFEFSSGADAEVGAGVEVVGTGAGAKSASRRRVLTKAGDPASCQTDTAATEPPGACSALLRVEVMPLGGAQEVAVTCPEGATWDGESCVGKRVVEEVDCPGNSQWDGLRCVAPAQGPVDPESRSEAKPTSVSKIPKDDDFAPLPGQSATLRTLLVSASAREALQYVPEDAFAVVGVDVDGLKQTSAFRPAADLMLAESGLKRDVEKIDRSFGLNWFRDLRGVLLVVTPAWLEDNDNLLAIAVSHQKVNERALVAALKREWEGLRKQPGPDGGLYLFDQRGELAIAFRGTYAFMGATKLVQRALTKPNRSGKTMQIERKPAHQSFFLLKSLPAKLRKDFGENLKDLALLTNAGGRLTVIDGGLQLVMTGTLGTEAAANGLARYFTETLADVAKDREAKRWGLTRYLHHVRIEPNGNELSVKLQLNKTELADMVAHAKSQRED